MASSPPKIVDNSVTLTFAVDGISSGAYWGYCTLADISYEFVRVASFTTLTNSVIGQEITGAAFELHQLLDHLYVMPYTGSNSGILESLRNMNAWLTVGRIVNRYYSGAEPDLSLWAAERHQWVAGKIEDLRTGIENWDTPFGDAVVQAQKPVYQLSKAAFGYPNPNATDPNAQTPIFTIGRTPFKSDMM
jgi:hypothetical protein